jgi:hypothetical protein
MSNHAHELYTYMYYTPYKAKTIYNPQPLLFTCHYGSRTKRVRADGRFAAREKAARYFGVGADKIIAVRV